MEVIALYSQNYKAVKKEGESAAPVVLRLGEHQDPVEGS